MSKWVKYCSSTSMRKGYIYVKLNNTYSDSLIEIYKIISDYGFFADE